MNTNFKPTVCVRCEIYIPAREGVWTYGNTYCADEAICIARAEARSERAQRMSGEQQRIMNDRDFVPTFPELIEWAAAYWRKRDAAEADPAVVEARRKRAAEDAAWAKRGLVRCGRCGGAGRSEMWRNTGYACYECNGAGTVAV